MSPRIAFLKQVLLIAAWGCLLASCATYAPKYASPGQATDLAGRSEVAHTFYLIGDAGLSPPGGMNPVLQRFQDRLSQAGPNSTALFLGDNIYPAGLPDPKDSPQEFQLAASHLEAQLRTLDQFEGRPVFIPGNHDWYNEGIKGLKRQEEYVEDYLDRKNVFLPENGCPIEVVSLSNDLMMILVDTEWYLTDWDKRPAINDDCEIKDREVFWETLGSEIKQHADKTILLAMHHPMRSYGNHGGQFTLRQQFYPYSGKVPLPVIGTLVNLFRRTAGVSIEDMQNKRYLELQKRMLTLARFGERVVIASGHEHTLQYIAEEGIAQIVSGSGAKEGATNLLGGSTFSTGFRGYAVLEVYTDKSSRVRYYGVDDTGGEKFLFTTMVHAPPFEPDPAAFEADFPSRVEAAVYTEDEVTKSGFYTRMWGPRYRELYGEKINVSTVRIDTLYGGLTPIRKGGGQQSKSLRLRHRDGREFVMRALRKQAEQNLQAMVFMDQYIIGDLENTAPEELLEDLYTGAHPYAPFALSPLMDTLGIYHTNPRLFYVPRQPALGKYNEDFGDELYMIEEHPSEGHEDLPSFGFAEDIKSTFDLIHSLRDDEKYRVDTEAYIRARLFDMLIGDWDRHQDQWRWAEFEDKVTGEVIYRPIPRDRDQAFSVMGDGFIGNLLTRLVPGVKKMEGFNEEIRNVRTFNSNPLSLDMTLLGGTTRSQWQQQARQIRQRITPEVIDASLLGIPPEVRGATSDKIRRTLLARLDRLEDIANDYFEVLQRYLVVRGTDKDDWFEIQSGPEGGVVVRAYRIIHGEKSKLFFERTLLPDLTREVWIYGLDDRDRFEIDLAKGTKIKVRIVGGLGRDRYITTSGNKAVIYDYKTRENRFEGPGHARRVLTDHYQVNTFQSLDLATFNSHLLPTAGFNPDDGMRLGLGYSFSRYGFRRNPFTYRHSVTGSFYFATSGFDLGYEGEFANVFGKWNLQVQARNTSPNFSQNFFGFGNESLNPDDELGLDYNRIRLSVLSLKPALIWRGPLGGSLRLGLGYERFKVEETSDRYINTFYQANGEENSSQFLGVSAKYFYENRDNEAFPTLGMSSSLELGYKERADSWGTGFGYVIPALSLDHRLLPSGQLVLATRWKAHFNLGQGYEFFQAARIGANDGPRSYRNERFSGKTAYYQLTDLRLQFAQMRTGIVPLSIGLFGGFDYGRVWQPGDSSSRWHTSYGGGLFLNGIDVVTLNTALFQGEDGLRFSFGLGFSF
ncbi:metallophosphoesterase [Robiginitalea sp. SC105]|uniref:metallophosphoesterase n=1 Tax=Robiginitalea sp. SC105 TaxID=2762332 RepID=UPI00163B515D|nr:metallophosphoesterase [Robiginitalea sp. SC105]MBC2837865.1 metallophosphoesterase [Robiginitalea sp. SC105]